MSARNWVFAGALLGAIHLQLNEVVLEAFTAFLACDVRTLGRRTQMIHSGLRLNRATLFDYVETVPISGNVGRKSQPGEMVRPVLTRFKNLSRHGLPSGGRNRKLFFAAIPHRCLNNFPPPAPGRIENNDRPFPVTDILLNPAYAAVYRSVSNTGAERPVLP